MIFFSYTHFYTHLLIHTFSYTPSYTHLLIHTLSHSTHIYRFTHLVTHPCHPPFSPLYPFSPIYTFSRTLSPTLHIHPSTRIADEKHCQNLTTLHSMFETQRQKHSQLFPSGENHRTTQVTVTNNLHALTPCHEYPTTNASPLIPRH